MTVCIAVSCTCEEEKTNPKIVLVSDTEFSLGITSTSGLKARAFANNWTILFAGEDVTYAEDVMEEAFRLIGSEKRIDGRRARTVMTQAYQTVRRECLQEIYLSTYGWSMDDFLKQPQDVPSVAHRQYLINEMEKFDLGCQFLVAGFDNEKTKWASVFEIQNPGIYVARSLMGYGAIGSGSINAISYLARREQDVITSFGATVYNALAAKRLAEKAPGVGKNTAAFILERGKSDVEWIVQNKILEITKIWNEEEAWVRPANLNERVSSILQPQAKAEPQNKALTAGG